MIAVHVWRVFIYLTINARIVVQLDTMRTQHFGHAKSALKVVLNVQG
jgi:hypothetical protein